MSKHTIENRLNHILENIENIRIFTNGKSIEDLKSDFQLEYAVVRAFEIIGEASKYIPEEIRSEYNNVPWEEIVAFRNILIHEYAELDLDRV